MKRRASSVAGDHAFAAAGKIYRSIPSSPKKNYTVSFYFASRGTIKSASNVSRSDASRGRSGLIGPA
jgi:hypothetical protein